MPDRVKVMSGDRSLSRPKKKQGLLVRYSLRSGVKSVRKATRSPSSVSGADAQDPTIMVGWQHQARIPNYTGCGPSDQQAKEDLLWSPSGTSREKVETYLRSLFGGPPGRPRDDERALTILMVSGYNPAVASPKVRALPHPPVWSYEDCSLFEDGIALYSKDFLKIRNHFLPHRPVSQLVDFYYYWKKSERHDEFVRTHPYRKQREEPASTDMMDLFLDHSNYSQAIKEEPAEIKREPND